MKQNKSIALLALLGALSTTAEGIKLPPSKLPEMYGDPEYADTWRYTNEERYTNSTQWEGDAPAGYTTLQMKADEEVPDYWSYDYSGGKHWKFANDPFYAKPEVWMEGAPKGYDDGVHDTFAQTESQNVPGVTFAPGRAPRLAQADSSVPDYWSWDYSGNKHWKFANDRFYADPDEWIDSAPKAYEVPDSRAQIARRSVPGVTFVGVDRN